jgi:hypothetical protein
MIMHAPVFGKEPSEKSQVRIAYDNAYIYVSASMFDREADKIMATSKKRDEKSAGNDWFCVIFDSFNDKENGLAFATTPAGLRCDYTIFKDGIVQLPEMPFNYDWNTHWDVKTTLDEQGWYVELRIPVSSMRFKEENGNAVMGLTCFRQIAHKNEIDVFPAIPPNWGMFSIFRPSQAREVVFNGIHARMPFYIAPFVSGGYQQKNTLNEAETAYDYKESPELNAGLDVKYGLTNNLTLDVTVNTDFAQVEADDEQINLTRFSLFFPEKRSFFQERSSIFSFDFDEGNTMFYSRNIGLSEGEIVPLYGGVRVTGMAGKWDLGLLDMQTREFDSDVDAENDLPSENFGILRMRRNILNQNSYLGGMAVSRIGTDGSYNVAYGADATIRMFGDEYLNVKLAQVVDDSAVNKMGSLNPTQLYFNWKRFTNKGLGYNFTYTRTGSDFVPEAGFQMRSDYSLASGSVNYGWIRKEAAAINNDAIVMNARNFHSNEFDRTESTIIDGGYFAVYKSGFIYYAGFSHQYEYVTDTFSFSEDADVLPETYRFSMLELHGQTPDTKKFYVGWDAFAGSFYDGNRISVNLTPFWNVNSSLQLSGQYGYFRLRFNERNQKFNGHLAQIRALLMFSTRLSLSSFVQINNADHKLVVNMRLRYNPREGNDFYIVYNEGRNSKLDREVPELPSMSERTILVKYTYTFSARK